MEYAPFIKKSTCLYEIELRASCGLNYVTPPLDLGVPKSSYTTQWMGSERSVRCFITAVCRYFPRKGEVFACGGSTKKQKNRMGFVVASKSQLHRDNEHIGRLRENLADFSRREIFKNREICNRT